MMPMAMFLAGWDDVRLLQSWKLLAEQHHERDGKEAHVA
jgi:hypothetical protein